MAGQAAEFHWLLLKQRNEATVDVAGAAGQQDNWLCRWLHRHCPDSIDAYSDEQDTKIVVLSLRKPSAQKIAEFLAAQAKLDLTCPAVEATRQTLRLTKRCSTKRTGSSRRSMTRRLAFPCQPLTKMARSAGDADEAVCLRLAQT
jgi:hypothetical protein